MFKDYSKYTMASIHHEQIDDICDIYEHFRHIAINLLLMYEDIAPRRVKFFRS